MATRSVAQVLGIMEKTFSCYITEDPAAANLKVDTEYHAAVDDDCSIAPPDARTLMVPQEKLNTLEASLAAARNTMALGYVDPDSGKFVKASSVQLRDKMRTSEDERMRKVC